LGINPSSLPSKIADKEVKAVAPAAVKAPVLKPEDDDEDKKTEVLGKAILDPESNPCQLQEGFESFTPYKNLWVNITRFNSGPATFFFDLVDVQFLNTFVTDAKADWEAFSGTSELLNTYVSEEQLTDGFKANKWQVKNGVTTKDYIKIYTQLETDEAMTFKDFLFFDIEF